MSSFNHPYTCPTIDSEIETIKDSIFEHVERLIESITLYVPEEVITKLAEECADTIYKDIGMPIERIRNTNEDLRYAAETQVKGLDEKVKELEASVEDLNRSIETLQDDLKDVNYELSNTFEELDMLR